eukprot:TRINITY_DN14392_c0_g1_i4.p1 TRINITY_DN14392_c0_g1~~TRINITY_DN14392_c0_g1_i4.p1  ORF type:complete len:1093 (+),score=456.17 TRINITY_DN14392_c0_g1_i4:114-3392(+)
MKQWYQRRVRGVQNLITNLEEEKKENEMREKERIFLKARLLEEKRKMEAGGKSNPEKETDDKEDQPNLPTDVGVAQEDVNITKIQRNFIRSLKGMGTANILNTLEKIDSTVHQLSGATVSGFVVGKIKLVYPILHQYLLLLDAFLFKFALFHREINKFHFLLLRLSNNLVKEGFCTREEVEEPQEGEMQFDDQENAGMGEGQGLKDVSDQMDNEEQVMGEKYDQEEQPQSNEKIENSEQGIEMSNDFEGAILDIENQPEDEDGEEEEEGEEEDIDRQMGETDKKHEEVVDERLWDKEEDEEEKKENNEEEVDGNASDLTDKKEEREQEMVAKEEEEGAMGEGTPKKKPEKSKPTNDEKEEVDEQEAKSGEQEEEEEVEDRKDDFTDDTYRDDKYAPQRSEEEEEFELPQDLNLDGEGGGDSDGGDESPMADKEEEQEDGKEEKETLEEQTDQVSENKEEQAEETQEAKHESEEEKKDEKDSKILEEDVEMDEEKKEDEEEPIQQDTEDLDPQHKDILGVKDKKGKATEDVKTMEQDNEGHEEQSQPTKKENTLQQELGAKQMKEDDGQKREQQKQKQQDEEREKRNKPKQREDPNPYRNLADAIKKWEKRLQPIDSEKKMDEETGEKPPQTEEKQEDPQHADDYEYLNKDDKKEEDAQALGNATEEQMKELEKEKLEFPKDNMLEMEEEMESEEEEMDVEGKEDEKGKSSGNELDLSTKPKLTKLRKEEVDDSDEKEVTKEMEKLEKDFEKEDLEGDKGLELISQGKDGSTGKFFGDFQPLTQEDLNKLRQDLMVSMARWQQDPQNTATGYEIWKGLQRITAPLSQELCEQLRLLLEPTQTAKLKGDFRTGKRLNMRKVIPYIASNYKKDKIWLRRQKPSKREYQVLLGIDDSESVAIGGTGDLLREAVATITQAFMLLDIGQLSIVKFGNSIELLHPFSESFTDADAAQTFPQLTFKQNKTNMSCFLETAIQMLELTRQNSSTNASATLMQLMFVISDGRFGNDREHLKWWLRRAEEQQIFCVFLVIDGTNKQQSILDIQVFGRDDKGTMSLTPYIDVFPFPFYVLLRRIENLPRVLADALRQWFEMIQRD